MDHVPHPVLSAGTRAFLDRRGSGELLIDGAWRPAKSGSTLPTYDPATSTETARIAAAGDLDVDAAVDAARKALVGWRSTTPNSRARVLWRIAELIEANIDELAEIETLDQGKPFFVGRWAKIPGAANQFRFFAGHASLGAQG